MSKSTSDFMSESELQDLRDAGRGHLIREDMADRADQLRTEQKEAQTNDKESKEGPS